MPHYASVQIVPTPVCEDIYGVPENYTDMFVSVICAIGEDKGSCQDDSGGPLACFHDGRWTQVGVVNSGAVCAHPLYPVIYTRVNHFYDWIETVFDSN
ncbi:serine protease 41-like [Dreissena polymorpha]|uniref:serine protease 41-like n=1 Tax=Dreissena polymorpha TaxID=45954 RepID=UPI0022651A53|nr:serine protease 41-like [Dreissena polymorpha]